MLHYPSAFSNLPKQMRVTLKCYSLAKQRDRDRVEDGEREREGIKELALQEEGRRQDIYKREFLIPPTQLAQRRQLYSTRAL